MPIYEYMCASCQKVHEMIQKFSDAPLAECPDCQGSLQKLMSRSSFALKGTGWYTTDYKRAPVAKPSATSSTSPSPAAESSKGTAPEVKANETSGAAASSTSDAKPVVTSTSSNKESTSTPKSPA